MSYGSRVGNLNSVLQDLSDRNAQSEEDTRDNLIQKSEEADEKLSEKLKGAEDITGDIVAGSLGVQGLYKSGKALKQSVQKVKDSSDTLKSQFQQPEKDEDVGFDGEELPFPEVIKEPFPPAPQAPEPFPPAPKINPPKLPQQSQVVNQQEEDDTYQRFGLSQEADDLKTDITDTDFNMPRTISRTLGGGDGEDLGSGLTSKLADGVSDTATDLVSSAGKSISADATAEILGANALDEIPVVGEIIGGTSALIGIGEEIYSLVHHTSPQQQPPENPSAFLVGSDVQQKYASLIPSSDTSVERGGGEGLF